MNTYTHRVQYYETDKMGITHHSNYIRWMEEARVNLLKEAGYGFSKMEELGISSPVISIECKYKLPSYFEDEISVLTFVDSITGVKMKIRYIMMNPEGKIIFTGKSEHAFFNKDGKALHIEKEMPGFYVAMEEYMAETPE